MSLLVQLQRFARTCFYLLAFFPPIQEIQRTCILWVHNCNVGIKQTVYKGKTLVTGDGHAVDQYGASLVVGTFVDVVSYGDDPSVHIT